MAMEGGSLYRPRWLLHRRDVKTATKWSLAEARPEGKRPNHSIFLNVKKCDSSPQGRKYRIAIVRAWRRSVPIRGRSNQVLVINE
jgi:hypothetical protein